MKVLISGANGSLGSKLTRCVEKPNAISLRSDSIDATQKAKLASSDVFIHCGALLKGSFNELINSNFLLTKELLDYLSAANPDIHFIYISTMSLLRKKQSVSRKDYLDYERMSDYALSKYLSEIIFSRYQIPFTIIRFSTLFYKNPNKDGLSKLIYDTVKYNKATIYNSGIANRDFLPLDIAARYVMKLVDNKNFYNKTLNIVSGQEISFKEIVEFLKTRTTDLEIENEKSEIIKDIPSNFDNEDIISIGRIQFDIFEQIDGYIAELLEEQ
jgi:nucleoside-diphosphate-sugar epimerase